MKNWRMLAALLLSLALVGSIACNPFGGTESESTQQLVGVVRGDLAITVSTSGNIEVSRERKLAFGIGGRVDKIYVEENDEVSKGEVLARLETDALELALTQAQVAHAQAQVAVAEAEVAVTRAEMALTQAQVAHTQAQVAVAEAEVAVTRAETAVIQAQAAHAQAQVAHTQAQVGVAEAEVAVTRAETAVTQAQAAHAQAQAAHAQAQAAVTQAQVTLQTAEEEYRLATMLWGPDTVEVVAIKKRQVEAAQQSLEATRQSQEATRQALELAELSPALARQSLELATQSLEQAQKQLDKATLVAPFAGIVARLYDVDEGDTISTATTILYLVDTSLMELKVQVDELDIPEVKLGQRAIIEVDALPALPLIGKVSSISLLLTVEAGVIVYDVTIDFTLPEGVGLRAGMSATTDIVINERSNVLLVPNRAINRDSQGNPVVEVMLNGQIEPKAVVTGISDGLQTEIINGLNEGETVVIEKEVKP